MARGDLPRRRHGPPASATLPPRPASRTLAPFPVEAGDVKIDGRSAGGSPDAGLTRLGASLERDHVEALRVVHERTPFAWIAGVVTLLTVTAMPDHSWSRARST
jgi:hypothetical protein